MMVGSESMVMGEKMSNGKNCCLSLSACVCTRGGGGWWMWMCGGMMTNGFVGCFHETGSSVMVKLVN